MLFTKFLDDLKLISYLGKIIFLQLYIKQILHCWNPCLIIYIKILLPVALVEKYVSNGRLNEMGFLQALSVIKQHCVKLF